MIKILILVIIAEVWLTAGQICFKKNADRIDTSGCHPERSEGSQDFLRFFASLRMTIKKIYSTFCFPIVWLGGFCMLIGMCFWFAALASGDLNFVYMLGSIQFIIMLFAAHFFLQEKINIHKLLGTLLITLGIVLTMIS